MNLLQNFANSSRAITSSSSSSVFFNLTHALPAKWRLKRSGATNTRLRDPATYRDRGAGPLLFFQILLAHIINRAWMTADHKTEPFSVTNI